MIKECAETNTASFWLKLQDNHVNIAKKLGCISCFLYESLSQFPGDAIRKLASQIQPTGVYVRAVFTSMEGGNTKTNVV